jgi:anti-sigma regulatory factor (Ser/Thr protein kinase)
MTIHDTWPASPAHPAGPLAWFRVFAAVPAQAREARRSLARVLDGHPAAHDAALCVAELTANAVLHSKSREPGGQFTVRAEIRPGDRLRVEVHDGGGPWTPPAPGDDQHGRGLLIVSHLALDWGRTAESDTGRIVWFEIECP